MKVIIVGAHGEAKELINRISSGWSISVVDLDQEKLRNFSTKRQIEKIIDLAKKMRKSVLELSLNCGEAAHIGGGLSIVDIMATLYGNVLQLDLKNPIDRFILSISSRSFCNFFASIKSPFISALIVFPVSSHAGQKSNNSLSLLNISRLT